MKRALGVSVATVAALLLIAAAAQAAPHHERIPAPREPGIPGPQVALERALAYFAPAQAGESYRRAAKKDPRGGTLVLRDLAANFERLTGSDRRLAAEILARPTDTGSGNYSAPKSAFRRVCPANFCVHWVKKTGDAPSLADTSPNNGRPDWIDKVITEMRNVWTTEIANLGYKKPKPDPPFRTHRGGNPNSKLDIFIQDVGRFDLYGYCTTDDPKRGKRRDVSAYCVLDDDYRSGQFPGTHGLDALKVTAAHEFHHASHFAYDWKEDRAFLEGTATKIEADVHPTIHDNYQFFSASPLRPDNNNADGPWWPIDMFDQQFGNQYGSWIWYQFLEEDFGDAAVIREIWAQAAAKPGTNNGRKYSTQAMLAAIAARSASFRDAFARFGAANAVPSAYYEDGALYEAQGGMAGAVDRGFFGPGDSDSANWPMYHFSNDYILFKPFVGATDIDLTLDFPPVANGSNATVLVLDDNGSATQHPYPGLDANGDATINDVPFSPGNQTGVVLVLTNDSVAMTNCGSDPLGAALQFACRGDALHDFANGFNWSVNVD